MYSIMRNLINHSLFHYYLPHKIYYEEEKCKETLLPTLLPTIFVLNTPWCPCIVKIANHKKASSLLLLDRLYTQHIGIVCIFINITDGQNNAHRGECVHVR